MIRLTSPFSQRIKRKDAEIKRLKEALCVVLLQNESDTPSEGDKTDRSKTASGESNEEIKSERGSDEETESENENAENPPQPVYDNDNELYFCSACMVELQDGICCRCGLEHNWIVDEKDLDTISTVNQAIHADRSLVPRGDTPLRFIDPSPNPPPAEYCASHYPVRRECRENEYMELLRRGATRLMCETFHLEFSHEHGIYAWADSDLFEEFSGPDMKLGDFWKIHLGRRIALDEDDLDGSEFIEGLLEDALVFPFRSDRTERMFEKWETREETPGIWVTQLAEQRNAEDEHHDSDDDAFYSDEDEEGFLDCFEMEDEALENPPEEEGPIRENQYTFSEDESDQEDVEMANEGFASSAWPDAVWGDDDSEIDELDDDAGDGEAEKPGDGMDASTDDGDSDFDSDEVLSGDEGVIAAGVSRRIQ
ncbi:hypothetical protein BDZ97DRAFT_1919939 [Flammula alnicola]|nr:hypothetical protein BDZ97DRAFT_1919939 [Flammula alnicola]